MGCCATKKDAFCVRIVGNSLGMLLKGSEIHLIQFLFQEMASLGCWMQKE